MPSKINNNTANIDTSTLKLKAENTELHHQLDAALKGRVLDEAYEDFVTKALHSSSQIVQPKWTTTPSKSRKHLVMPVASFSDWHLDEVVRPEEIQHKNGYNRQIALKRLEFYTHNVCMVARDFIKGFEFPGIVVNMLGDNFSGFIHDELRRTNADTMMGSLLFWVGPVVTMLETCAKEFGKVYVPGVVGNHGRHDKKPLAKMRAQENFDWLFMHMVRTVLEQKGEKRVQFEISNGQKLRFNVFDTRVIISHGDECKGGSGIAGMLSPQLIAYARMKKTYEFDQWWIGHWHHLSAYRGIRVNGAGKGYDEYAAIMNFDYQVPLQDFFLIAPGHGTVASWPIHCMCPDEPWANKVAKGAKAFAI